MENHNFKWRIWAKAIAIIDLLSVSLQLLGSIYLTFVASIFTGSRFPEIKEWTWLMWIGAAVMLIQTGVGLWAALQLLKATKLGQRAQDAYNLSQNWQTVSIVLMLVGFINAIILGIGDLTIVSMLSVPVRIIFLCIVFGFMREVDKTIKTTTLLMTPS